MNRLLLTSLFLLFLQTTGSAQVTAERIYQDPTFAIKTNLLYWGTTTPNLGIEFRISDRFTIDASGNLNPWKFSESRKMKHWLFQPELRYWMCRPFGESFWGLHLHGGQFNVGGITFLGIKQLKNYRHEGWLVGAGISYGYQWILSNRWNLEASLGAGYAYINYDKFPCGDCGTRIKSSHKHYWGPTKAALSLIYILK